MAFDVNGTNWEKNKCIWLLNKLCVLPVSQRWDEVETAVNSVVHDVPAVQTALIVQVALELIINILYDGLKAVREKNKDQTQFNSHKSMQLN